MSSELDKYANAPINAVRTRVPRHCSGRQTHPSISGRRDNYGDCRTCHCDRGITNNYCKSSMLIKYVPSHLSSKEVRDNVNSVVSSLVHMINFVINIFNCRDINFRILHASIVSLIIVLRKKNDSRNLRARTFLFWIKTLGLLKLIEWLNS